MWHCLSFVLSFILHLGSTQEISQLQRQLSLTQHEKENVEEMYKTMEVQS